MHDKWLEIIESAVDAMFFVDSSWRVQHANSAADRLFENSGLPMSDRHYREFLHEGGETSDDCPVTGAVRTGRLQRGQVVRAGQKLEVTAYPILDSAGGCAGCVCVATDLAGSDPGDSTLPRPEHEFRDIFEAANVGKALTLPTGEIEVNAAFARMLGYAPKALPYRTWQEITYPPDIPASEHVVAILIAGEHTEYRFVKRYVHRDGSLIWTDVSTVLRRSPDGRPLYFITTIVDITAQKASEELHRQAEERFTKAFQASPAGMTITRTSDRRLVDVNEAYLAMMEAEREEVVGSTLEGLGLWGPLAGSTGTSPEGSAGHSRDEEVRIRTKSGRPCEVLVSSTHIMIGGEEHLVTTWIEITERKRAERKLAQSEEHYRALFENMNAGFVLFEIATGASGEAHDLIVKAANEVFASTTGLIVSEILGRKLTEVLPGIEDDEADWIQKYGEVASSGEPLSFEAPSELLERQFSVNAYQAGPGHCAVTFQDVTERATMRAEKAQLEQQLQQAMKLESVGRLASGVAHDFNNMLSVIIGYGELVLQGLPDDSPQRIEVDEILKAGQRSAELTHQLLAFSRTQALHPEVVDLSVNLHNLERMLRPILGEDITLSVECEPDAGKVLVDPGQLEQIVVNLAANARDAMRNGGRLLIEVASVTFDEARVASHPGVNVGRYTMLSVSDNGPGIPQEILDRVFDPFFTTKERGKGTGLGLATTYGIVKQSGGDIWVYSEPGLGTVFKIFLPVTDREDFMGDDDPEGGSAHGKGERILVVEDDLDVRSLIGRVLPRMGYQPLIASDCDDAVQMIERHHIVPDLVLTDVIMPSMNGPELIDRLRGTLPELKTLFMSGYTGRATELNGTLEQGTPFIQKPFAIEDLAEKIGTVLSRG